MDFALSVESKFAASIVRRYNTWYSVSDGNWSDPNTWISTRLDKKVLVSPQQGDDVYINHSVTCDVSAAVGNCRVSGTLKFSGSVTLSINGDLQAVGAVDQSGGANTIILQGVNNSIVSYTPGTSSTVQYDSLDNFFNNISPTQPIMPLAYYNLILLGGFKATKNLQANLSVTNNFTIDSILNTNGFDISIGGTTNCGNIQAVINSTTNILFTGQFINISGGSSFNIVGAASVEMRGGSNITGGACSWPNSNVNFTTNNQTLTGSSSLLVNNVTVTGALTVNTSGTALLSINGTLNGTVGGSTFNNDSKVQFNSTNTQMTTGVFNYIHTAGSTITYNVATNFTLPFSTYENLQLLGNSSVTVTAGSNLTLNKNLLVQGAILDLSTFNLTVTGTTMVQSTLKKTGAGSVLFVGAVSYLQLLAGVIDFSGGNPTVEFRGGIVDSTNNGTYITGTGAISFTTNNQTVNFTHITQTWNAPITIAAGITVTDVSTVITYAGVLNGASSTAIYDCRGTVNYTNATAPMVTGKFYGNQAANTFLYSAAGGQDIIPPSDPSTPGYKNLTLTGSGAKKLLGNVSVKGTYILSGTATLNSNGFALTNP